MTKLPNCTQTLSKPRSDRKGIPTGGTSGQQFSSPVATGGVQWHLKSQKGLMFCKVHNAAKLTGIHTRSFSKEHSQTRHNRCPQLHIMCKQVQVPTFQHFIVVKHIMPDSRTKADQTRAGVPAHHRVLVVCLRFLPPQEEHRWDKHRLRLPGLSATWVAQRMVKHALPSGARRCQLRSRVVRPSVCLSAGHDLLKRSKGGTSYIPHTAGPFKRAAKQWQSVL